MPESNQPKFAQVMDSFACKLRTFFYPVGFFDLQQSLAASGKNPDVAEEMFNIICQQPAKGAREELDKMAAALSVVNKNEPLFETSIVTSLRSIEPNFRALYYLRQNVDGLSDVYHRSVENLAQGMRDEAKRPALAEALATRFTELAIDHVTPDFMQKDTTPISGSGVKPPKARESQDVFATQIAEITGRDKVAVSTILRSSIDEFQKELYRVSGKSAPHI